MVAADRWSEAAQALDALSEEMKKDPQIRLVRGRVAMHMDDFSSAQTQLAGLEKKIPELKERIRSWQAQASLEVGPYEPAARYYQKQSSPDDWIKSARAWHRAGKNPLADKQLRRVLKRARHHKRRKAQALMLRAAIHESRGKKASAAKDYRWLATEAPEYGAQVNAAQALAKLSPKRALTKRERQRRARLWADRGDVSRAEQELKQLAQAKGKRVAQYEVDFIRGWARYSSRRYKEAAEALGELAQKKTPHKERARFYAARALSRIHQNDEAIRRYQALAKDSPKSSYASRALYLAARIRYIGGEWPQAIEGYQAFLKAYPRSGNVKSARYELALALLINGQHEAAAKRFSALKARDKKHRAWLSQLEGVARLRMGDTQRARALFQATIKSEPLSFPALASATRLAAMGEPVRVLPGGAGAENPEAEDPTSPPIQFPSAVSKLAELGLLTDAEALLKSQAKSFKKAHGRRGDRALCEAFGELNRGRERFRVGVRAISSATLEAPASPDTRWAWDCTHPRPYEDLVTEAAKRWDLSDSLVYGLMRQESGYRPQVVSPAGAVGLMQIMPATGRKIALELSLGFDVTHLREASKNVHFGAFYLRKLLNFFDANVPVALAAYNAGPVAVSRWLNGTEDVDLDLWVARIPYRETRHYVAKVLRNRARYAYLSGGVSAVSLLPMKLPEPPEELRGLY